MRPKLSAFTPKRSKVYLLLPTKTQIGRRVVQTFPDICREVASSLSPLIKTRCRQIAGFWTTRQQRPWSTHSATPILDNPLDLLRCCTLELSISAVPGFRSLSALWIWRLNSTATIEVEGVVLRDSGAGIFGPFFGGHFSSEPQDWKF